MRSSPLSRLLKRLILLGLGTLVGLIAAEIALRMAGPSNLPQGVFFIGDPYTGWTNRPGTSGVWIWEGNAPVTINSQGLRDREHAVPKPPGTLRIAVLGDSFAAAFQVSQSDDFCSVLERTLRSCQSLGGRTPEVINFGVNAYGTGQELIALEHRVWRYRPDIVVLAYYVNDVYDDSEALQEIYPDYVGGPRPYFRLSSDGLVEDDSRLRSPSFQAALKESGDPNAVFGEGFHRILWKSRLWRLISRFRSIQTSNRAEVYELLKSPSDQTWENAWKVTEALLSRFNQEVQAGGARFVLLVVSNSLQVYPGAEERNRLLQKAGVSDVFYLNRRLEALGKREGFPVVSLAEPMQQYADAHHVFFHGFPRTGMGTGHWNAQGHLMAGQSIASAICAMLSGTRPPVAAGVDAR
ncbi:MAG TPA: SGNH/GDSL hydrolase family protein [Candidatus Binataceae bacterium]|nr:SGNH/GDSL hydrolase family protein [Candidatus Binataceae bacterium]